MTNGLKVLVVGLMIVQVLCIAYGIFKLTEGDMYLGLFLIILNAVFFIVNTNTLKY